MQVSNKYLFKHCYNDDEDDDHRDDDSWPLHRFFALASAP